jgi:probable rRNA maturation factor
MTPTPPGRDHEDTGMIEVQIEDAGWRVLLPRAEALAMAAAKASLAALPNPSPGDLVILLTSDAAVRDLNARFRGKDQPTNVLSFPAGDNPHGHLGDIALALGVCAAEARAQNKPLADHLRHLVAHGVLHLVGYDHQDDGEAEAMEGLEREILAGLGVRDPYAQERDGAGSPPEADHA